MSRANPTNRTSQDEQGPYQWTYESIVDAVPGVTLPDWLALTIQFVLFEGLLLAIALRYDLWDGVPAGTAAVVVATTGSALMLAIARRIRTLSTPATYRKLLFGSSIEIVLGLLSYVGLVTYLFVYNPRQSGTPLLESILGTEPPIPAVFLTLLILWDVCYRIGTAWWASVTGFWVAVRRPTDRETRSQLRKVDALIIGFSLLQLVLVPFVRDHGLLVFALVGHVIAVTCVSGSAIFVRSRG
ncbi:hypothetical protein ACFFQF_26310 [Haladaptatus pallidirubidus]|uniref:Uncharacterized protein n=1 Tax=Haladaptatus pallidirubidus TaxID=1008152 RepID=A0AAV3UN56_9EURY|nr:hypothetical protein [Haladaptatus pallidirubidus]